MAINFNLAWLDAGMDRVVSTQNLTTTYPSHSAMGSQSLDVKGPQGSPVGQSLVATYPSHTPAKVLTLEETGIRRRGHDHHGDYNFVIEIDGVQAGAFQKCAGLSLEVDEIVYRDGLDAFERKRPGAYRFGSIKLTKGYTSSGALWGWCEAIMNGELDRRNGSIRLVADDGDETLATYEFYDAWPKKWTGFALDGKGAGALIEEVELAVELIARVD